jgi:hypothetical protein
MYDDSADRTFIDPAVRESKDVEPLPMPYIFHYHHRW